MNIPERISALRALMEERGYDVYMVPTDDFHQSEYVGDHFKVREYITGFTGSAGTAVFTKDEAGLWTDGRYFLQADQQLAGTGVKLYKMGEPGVPTVEEFIASALPEGGTLGFDGRVVAIEEGAALEEAVASKDAKINYSEDLVGEVWADRPALSEKPAFALGEEYTGESTESKLARVREAMKKAGADVHVIAALDDVCWITNLRGDDVDFFPLLLSYAVITMDDMKLYIDERKLNDDMKADLAKNNITIHPYNAIYEDIKNLDTASTVLVDPNRLNYALFNNIPDGTKVVQQVNPTIAMKAKKNDVEIRNIINAHKKDAVAMTKWMYWLKTNIGKIPMTEISASDYLEARRREQENFIDLSFTTISAYGANAAMMHYSATPESNTELKPEGFLLVDSGGHYYEGTTDITRTFVLGPISDEMKQHFTAVCRSNMKLANAKFLYGACGLNLDILARGPLWDMGIDYKCGTGHGVGYILNVHEGPNGFRWKIVPERHDSGVLEEGMITTDEPGVYLEGKYGIRTENELVCRKAEKNEYGQFMEFENITYAPIDLDGIDPEQMSPREKQMLNDYHKKVYEVLSPYMTEEENEWLKKYTRAI